jgi:hypothetical protein
LHVPKASQVAFDSFFQLGATLYFFQFTVSKSPYIKEFLSGQLPANILPPKENWRFVFIIPPGCEVDVKATSEVEEFLEGVRLYSAHLEIEEQAAGSMSMPQRRSAGVAQKRMRLSNAALN